MSDTQPVRNCLLCHPEVCTGACRPRRDAEVCPQTSAVEPSEDLIRGLLDEGSLLQPALPETLDWRSGFDLAALSPAQVAFIGHYFCAGDSQYHQARSAARAGVTTRTVLRWKDEPAFAEAYEAVETYQVNECEAQLMQLVRAGDLRAVTYALDRIGGRRWSPKAQLDLSTGGGPITGFTITVVGGTGASA